MNPLLSNEFLFGLANYLDASRPRYAIGQIPESPNVPTATAQGMLAGRKQDQQQKLGEIVKQKGWAGLMDDPEAAGLMAEYSPDLFMKGLMAQKVAEAKAESNTAPIRNYEYRNRLADQFGEGSPEVRQYDNYVRANQWLNLGGAYTLPNVQNPSLPAATMPKTLAPEDLPSTRGAQAEAAAAGKVTGEMKGTEKKQGVEAGKLLDLTGDVEKVIQKSTGSGIGTMVDNLGRFFGVATEGAVAGKTLETLQSSLMRFVPRLEGPQSDADRAAYVQAIGSLGNTTLTRAERIAALGEVRRIAEKYQFYGDTFVPGAGTTGKYAPVSPAEAPKASGKTSSGVGWTLK